MRRGDRRHPASTPFQPGTYMSRLDIGIDLEYQVLEPSEFIFKIHPASNSRQRILRPRVAVEPAVPFVVESCRNFGNQHLRFHAEPGQLNVHYSAHVDLEPVLSSPAE